MTDTRMLLEALRLYVAHEKDNLRRFSFKMLPPQQQEVKDKIAHVERIITGLTDERLIVTTAEPSNG